MSPYFGVPRCKYHGWHPNCGAPHKKTAFPAGLVATPATLIASHQGLHISRKINAYPNMVDISPSKWESIRLCWEYDLTCREVFLSYWGAYFISGRYFEPFGAPFFLQGRKNNPSDTPNQGIEWQKQANRRSKRMNGDLKNRPICPNTSYASLQQATRLHGQLRTKLQQASCRFLCSAPW